QYGDERIVEQLMVGQVRRWLVRAEETRDSHVEPAIAKVRRLVLRQQLDQVERDIRMRLAEGPDRVRHQRLDRRAAEPHPRPAACAALPVSTTSQKYLSWRKFIYSEYISNIRLLPCGLLCQKLDHSRRGPGELGESPSVGCQRIRAGLDRPFDAPLESNKME